jgi:hypothetical protein
MTSQGTAHGRFQRAIQRRHVQAAEMAAREMGGLSLADALSLCELLANLAYVAQQLGHSVGVLCSTYAGVINANAGAERGLAAIQKARAGQS